MAKLGLSFSGGGTRSAAFCSGVLRRLLQKNVNVDYLSCVSGGGYTGTAYLDWKYRHEKKDNKKWHQEFFNHLRENIGLICNFQKPCQAILEFLAIFALILFVVIIAPVLLWSAYAHPLAYIIDFLFGSILRGGDPSCPEVARNNPNITVVQCEEERRGSGMIYRRFALFASPVVLSLIAYVIKSFVQKGKGFFQFLVNTGVIFFALVFFSVVHKRILPLPSRLDETPYQCPVVRNLDFISAHAQTRYTDDRRVFLLVRYSIESFP